MVESKSEDSDTTVKRAEEKESGKGACLYVSSVKSSDSTTIIIKKLESLGFTVIKESSIASASQLCASMRMALIVLEDCEENNFIETIKSPKACNEYTPIVFISSGPLSDSVRHLMQEQYIDELVFKCLTLECDLGSAVNRLITQPGQFAVTPKSKRPGIVRKRKFDKAFLSSRNNDCEGAAAASPKEWQIPASNWGLHVPSVSSYLHGYDNTQSAYNHINPLLMSLSPMHQQDYHEKKSGVPIPAKQMSWGGLDNTQLLPHHPYHYYRHVTNGKSNVHVKKDRGGTESTIMSSGYMQSDKKQPSVVTKEEGKKQAMEKTPQDISSTKQIEAKKSCDGASVNSNDKNNQSGKKTPKTKADKSDNRNQEKNVNAESCSPSSVNKGDITGLKRKKPRSTGLTSLERKEHHLDKEKKRRERITKSWHWLRQLVPNCDPYADKATVFEMCVAYFHHCWNNHGPLLQQINKDFSSLNKVTISLEDMEKKVMEVLSNERKAFGIREEQS
nr:uncharacterized protein LOC131782957 isoform X1 [Pocillopora verrucosa]